jgi:hypothetical protein
MSEKTMKNIMLNGYASSARSVIEYAERVECGGEECLVVPKRWFEGLFRYVDDDTEDPGIL